MTHSDPDRLPEDLQPVAALLRANRPEATPLELDGVLRRVRSRASRNQKGTTMKSRLAMTAMLVLGLTMSGTGAGLAVTGLSATDNAAISQYRPITPPAAPGEGGVLPDSASGEPGSTTESEPAEVAPAKGGTEAQSAPAVREQGAQPARQVAASGGDALPFTGFAAIPILIAGIALLAGGLVLRRRTA
jgi:hypothetical protein